MYRVAVFLILLKGSLLIAQGNEQPNIIFYLSDDQDKLDYGCYGNGKIHTPSVDQLASEGLLFQNAFTGQAICAPSRSQLYTGNYPLKNGCFLNHISVKENQKSVTTYLGELGYEVILAGKSHVKPWSVFSWDRAWPPVPEQNLPRPYIPMDSIQNYFKSADQPFCMFITSEFPHGPYIDAKGDQDDFKFYPFNENSKNNPSSLKSHAGYYRNVEEDDKQLEQVLEWIDKFLGDNTLFIYAADHGWSGKFTVYDRGLNVPFIARWPGVIVPGSESDVLIHYTDMVPTFVEIAGGEVPSGVDGKSILPVLRGDDGEIHDYVYGVQTNQNIQKAKVFPSRMVRSKQYKYIRNFNSHEVVENNLVDNEHVNGFLKLGAAAFPDTPFEELYDIVKDPFEQHNLADNPDYKNIKKEMVAALFDWMDEQGDFLAKENYMPILWAPFHKLDESNEFKKVPPNLENTLEKEDYLILHY